MSSQDPPPVAMSSQDPPPVAMVLHHRSRSSTSSHSPPPYVKILHQLRYTCEAKPSLRNRWIAIALIEENNKDNHGKNRYRGIAETTEQASQRREDGEECEEGGILITPATNGYLTIQMALGNSV
ncbi:unnamed protein product [Xylocopa violacea]|uniref:Uncharacterized protein n=1 Tax=Xylocopa violacea TaxID=135666 RepID=A0ABP1N315_XYLVO